MKNLELVFIPTPVIGHLSSALEIANLLVDRYERLSITILLVKLPFKTKTRGLIDSLCASSAAERIRFIVLPEVPIDGETQNSILVLKAIFESQKLQVAETVAKLASRGPDAPTLAGFVVDMFCITMIDVANQFGVPTYVFFTSNSGFLALLFHLQQLYDCHNEDLDELLDSATEFAVPSFSNPIPGKIISSIFFDKGASEWMLENTRRFREASGILVNTFSELEPNTMSWFSNGTATSPLPPVYAVGPILNLKKIGSAETSETTSQSADIMKWLDEQPPSSVVFLCFGSLGSFNEDQIKEIAHALEQSGFRFLWSLRPTAPKGKHEPPSDDAKMEDVLPDGFLDRTAGIGKVIGWAPQVEILGHPATGGFVSHCGWNSTLESLRYGVPMATWSMYAEQQFNAFEMVVELGLAVEISLEYSMKEEGLIVSAEKIEIGMRKVMDGNDELKKLTKVKSEESKRALMAGGSSFIALDRFLDAVIAADSPCIIE